MKSCPADTGGGGGGQVEDTSVGNGDFVHLLNFIYRFNVNSDSLQKRFQFPKS